MMKFNTIKLMGNYLMFHLYCLESLFANAHPSFAHFDWGGMIGDRPTLPQDLGG